MTNQHPSRRCQTVDNSRIRLIVKRMSIATLIVFITSVVLTRTLYGIYEGQALSLSQSIMFVIQTYTTTGYGELLPFRSGVMNVYASVQMVLGVGLILFGLATAAGAWMQSRFQEIAPIKLPKKMKDHIILCGYSPLADSLAEELTSQQIPYVIVERSRSQVLSIMQRGLSVILGDPTEQSALAAAGIADAHALITTEVDETNVHIVLEARSMSNLPILVAVDHEHLREALVLAGATEVIEPKKILGEELARVATSSLEKQLVLDIDHLGDLYVMEFPVGIYCQFANQSILKSRIRETTGVTILGLWINGVFQFADSPHMVLSEESMVVVLGTREQLKKLDESMSSHLYELGQNSNRYVVAGYGDVARRTVEILAEQGNEVRLIVNEPVPEYPYVFGDITSRSVLMEAGIEKAGTYIISAPTDEKAVFSVLMARQINPNLRIYVRANSHTNVRKLYRAGADFVLSVSKISGNIMSNLLITKSTQIISDLDIHFFQHQVSDRMDRQAIKDAELLKSSGCMVIAIKKGADIIQNPAASIILTKGDILVLLANGDNMKKFKELTA
jgi:Trk K+ transport system NAD-binding subunit